MSQFHGFSHRNFTVNVSIPWFLSQVIAKGPGLEKNGVVTNKWAEFTVDCRSAGAKAPLHISCMDVDYNPVEVQVMTTELFVRMLLLAGPISLSCGGSGNDHRIFC